MSIHPARFSVEIVTVIRGILDAHYPNVMGRPIVHDPFAGTGERLADLCSPVGDGWGFHYSGTEIEECFIAAPGIICGSATDPDTYPPVRFPDEISIGGWVVVTSPVYSNGMADSHKPKDPSKRYGYRVAKIQITGDPDANLHKDNMGRYGYRGTRRDGNSQRRKRYWEIAEASVANWSTADMAIVNVSDFITKVDGERFIEPLVEDWVNLLGRHGWLIDEQIPIGTPRMRNGENADARVDYEYVIVARNNTQEPS